MGDSRPTGWIVDTNVISRPSDAIVWPALHEWIATNAALISISVVTIAEIRRGLLLAQAKLNRLSDLRARRRDQVALDAKVAWYRELRSRFADRFLPIDDAVAERWADVSVRFPSIRDGDKAILATALVHGCGIATRNLRDFRSLGVPLVDPFDVSTW